MKDERKTKRQLINELAEMRQWIAELETSETERKRAEEVLWKQIHNLGEQVKELNCLYGISYLVEEQDISLGEIFKGIVDLIPPAWQYPEITCAQIILEGQIFRTNNFEETIWKQSCDIIMHGGRIGTLEVCYLQEKPESDEGPFLKEERSLINAIAERLGRLIERKRAEEALRKAHEELERRVEERTAECVRFQKENISSRKTLDDRVHLHNIGRERRNNMGMVTEKIKLISILWKKKPTIETIMGPETQLEGVIHSSGIVRIDGFLNGGIADAEEVIIGKTGKVKGDIKAKTVVLSGNVTGNITASNSIKMLPNSEVYGDIETTHLFVFPGVMFQGNCTMTKEKTKVIDIEKRKQE